VGLFDRNGGLGKIRRLETRRVIRIKDLPELCYKPVSLVVYLVLELRLILVINSIVLLKYHDVIPVCPVVASPSLLIVPLA